LIKRKANQLVRSINYEYILNILAIIQFLEIAIKEQYYTHTIEQVEIWFIFQIIVNVIFLISLLMDLCVLGFVKGFSSHPRVFTEFLSQLICLSFYYTMLSNGWHELLYIRFDRVVDVKAA
jgi:hypothetical protein